MYQFFVSANQINGERVSLLGEDVNHIKNVLRMRAGEEILISVPEEDRTYHCVIEALWEDEIIANIASEDLESTELPSRIYLFQGLPKSDKMELIIQKAVELGAYEIVPMATKRCVVKLDEKREKNKLARWQGIAEAAAKQSKRGLIPQVHEILKLKEALLYAKEMDVILFPYEMAEDMDHTRACLEAIRPGQSVAIFIGPEGGFERSEVEAASEAGAVPITLGKRILRTETAGFTVLSWLMYHLQQ